MKDNTKFKEDLQDFIEERLNESYTNIVKNKNYKEISNKYANLMENIIQKLNDNKLADEYRKTEIDMYEMQLQQAYITGFKDSSFIHNNENF